MNSILKCFIIGLFLIGIIMSLLSYNFFNSLNLYRARDDNGNTQKFYVIDEVRAKELFNEFEQDVEEEDFDLIRFFERLNGDFRFEY